jgi:hypothetical protein
VNAIAKEQTQKKRNQRINLKHPKAHKEQVNIPEPWQDPMAVEEAMAEASTEEAEEAKEAVQTAEATLKCLSTTRARK